MKKILLLIAITFCLSTPVYAGTITAGNNGAIADGSVSGNTAGGGATQQRGSRFVMNSDGGITQAATDLVKTNSPTDGIVANIEADAAGVPSNIVLFTSATVADSTIGTSCPSAVSTTFTFTGVSGLTNGGVYWIVYSRTGADDNTNFISFCNDGAYSAPNTIGYRIANVWASANLTYFYQITTAIPVVASRFQIWFMSLF